MTTVLLVEDEANSIALAQRAFRKTNVPQPQIVNDGEAAIAYLNGDGDYGNRDQSPLPALILLDLDLPKKNGFEVLEWLRAQPSAAIKHIPVVALTTQQTSDEMKRAYDLGASLYLVKPLTAKSLGDSIDRLVFTFDPPQRIMICDDDPDHRARVERDLLREFPQAHIEHVTDMESFVSALDLGPFDLVITELHLKSLNGLTVLRTVKAHWAYCAVIMITNHGDEEIVVEAMKAGVDDYVLKSPEHFSHFNNAVHTALSRVFVRRAKIRAEEKYRALVEQVPAIIYTAALTLKSGTLYVSPQIEITGYSQEEWIANPDLWLDSIHPDDRARTLEAIRRTFTNHEPFRIEYRLSTRDGHELWIRDEGQVILDASGKPLHLQGVMIDVTERKQTESLLRQSEERYRTLAEAAHDMIFIINREGEIEYVNRSAAEQFRAKPEQIVGKLMKQVFPPAVAERQWGAIQKVIETGEPFYAETKSTFPFGDAWLSTSLVPLKSEGGSVRAVLGIARDITERKRADEEIARRANQFAALYEITRDISAQQENLSGLLLSIVDRAVDLFQAYSGMLHLYDPVAQNLELVMERNSFAQVGSRLTLGEGLAGRIAQERIPLMVDNYQKWEGRSPQLEGLPIAAVMGVPLLYGGELIGALTIAETANNAERRFTEEDARLLSLFAAHVSGVLRNAYSHDELRRRVDELSTLSRVSSALRYALTPSEIMPIVLDQIVELMKVDGALIALRDPHSGDTTIPLGRGKAATPFVGTQLKAGEGVVGHVITTKFPYFSNDAHNDPHFLLSHLLGDTNAFACVPLIAQNETIGALWIGRVAQISDEDMRVLMSIADSTAGALHRAKLGVQTEQQLRRLESLHTIDVTISSTFDLRLTLNIVLEHIIAQLGVDAADVLLFNASTQTLSYFTGHGFRNNITQGMKIKMGTGFAGKAAMSRSRVVINDLKAAQKDVIVSDPRNFNAEGFVAYYGVPLLAKGEIKGVLEIFHRAPLAPEAAWLDFLESLGTQTTIAIDNIQLFDNLQRTNANLNLSYDETLESWARISDQRAHRDEGYTRRAADLTLQLAQTLSIRDAELAHLRRGVLLYDIGSVMIPDNILLKTNPLTAEELGVIRQHPDHSRRILSTIRQLQHALDIPYHHHERWDGSGYPLGLRGEEIPYAARIFAVVDVWMALQSARPYRAALSNENARQYLRSMAGVQFDPRVVEVFLTMDAEINL